MTATFAARPVLTDVGTPIYDELLAQHSTLFEGTLDTAAPAPWPAPDVVEHLLLDPEKRDEAALDELPPGQEQEAGAETALGTKTILDGEPSPQDAAAYLYSSTTQMTCMSEAQPAARHLPGDGASSTSALKTTPDTSTTQEIPRVPAAAPPAPNPWFTPRIQVGAAA